VVEAESVLEDSMTATYLRVTVGHDPMAVDIGEAG